MVAGKPKIWMGSPPEKCQLCHSPIETKFYDARMSSGTWAILDQACFIEHCEGVGEGKGQEYTKRFDGKWVKTRG